MRTDNRGKTLRPCGTKLMPRCSSSTWLSPTMSSPSYQMLPDRTRTIPKIALIAVDLPAPLGPMTVVSALRRTENVVPCSTAVAP